MPLLSRFLAASNTSSSTIIASTASPRLVLRSSITSKPSITAPDFTPVLTTKALSTLNPNKPNYPLPKLSEKTGQSQRDPIFHPFSRAHRNPLTIHGRRSTSNKIDIVVDQKLCDSFTNLLLRASYRSSLCCADQARESWFRSRSCSGSPLQGRYAPR